MPSKKRARTNNNQCVVCPTCEQDMSVMADHLDFWAIRVSKGVRTFLETKTRLPSTEELEAIAEAWGASDPCDDCVCGACGTRKDTPGECHC